MNKIYFFHGKTTDGNRFTIAGQYTIKKSILGVKSKLHLGLSLCSGKDAFVKRVGRLKAEKRSDVEAKIGHFSIRIKDLVPSREISTFVEKALIFSSYNNKDIIRVFNLRKDGK